jgi:hypothetical protein
LLLFIHHTRRRAQSFVRFLHNEIGKNPLGPGLYGIGAGGAMRDCRRGSPDRRGCGAD